MDKYPVWINLSRDQTPQNTVLKFEENVKKFSNKKAFEKALKELKEKINALIK